MDMNVVRTKKTPIHQTHVAMVVVVAAEFFVESVSQEAQAAMLSLENDVRIIHKA